MPIVYERYRTGGENEWTKNSKPWTTPTEYKQLRTGLTKDMTRWFEKHDKQFKQIHATEPIKLLDANQLWIKQSGWRYPKYKSLEAYVSFFAFGRFVDK